MEEKTETSGVPLYKRTMVILEYPRILIEKRT
jgi:hypothetical protein